MAGELRGWKGTNLMVAFVDDSKAPLANIADNNIWFEFVILRPFLCWATAPGRLVRCHGRSQLVAVVFRGKGAMKWVSVAGRDGE